MIAISLVLILKQYLPGFRDFDTVWHFSKMLIFAILFLWAVWLGNMGTHPLT